MTISDRTGASPFLTEPDATCPADFLALAAGGDPLPVGFVRAIGAPILETARDAVAAGVGREHGCGGLGCRPGRRGGRDLGLGHHRAGARQQRRTGDRKVAPAQGPRCGGK